MQGCWAVLRSSDHERVCDATLKKMNSMFDALAQNAWEWWNAKMIRARATLLANVNLKCVCVDGTAVCCNSKAEGLIKCTRKLETQWMLNFGQALNRWLQQTWIWAQWQRQRREKWGDAFGSLCTLLAGYRVWLLSFSNDLFVRYHMAPGQGFLQNLVWPLGVMLVPRWVYLPYLSYPSSLSLLFTLSTSLFILPTPCPPYPPSFPPYPWSFSTLSVDQRGHSICCAVFCKIWCQHLAGCNAQWNLFPDEMPQPLLEWLWQSKYEPMLQALS